MRYKYCNNIKDLLYNSIKILKTVEDSFTNQLEAGMSTIIC